MSKKKFRNSTSNTTEPTMTDTTQDQNVQDAPAESQVVETAQQVTEQVQQNTEVVQQTVQEEQKAPEVVQPVVEPKLEVKTEVQAAPQVQQKPVQQPTQVKKQNFLNIDDYLIDLKENGTTTQKNLIAALDKYLEDLKPRKPIANNKGADTQYLFWKTLWSVVEHSTQEEFKSLWTIVLAYFDKYKNDAFNERYVYRFAEYWNANVDELTAFQRLLNLIHLTADPKQRSLGLKQVNVDKSLEMIFSEQGRQKVLNFYH